jgi:hypothetical protein
VDKTLPSHMNWSYRVATTAASKLPLNWQEQGTLMAQQVAHLVTLYNIAPQLVINTVETGLHVVPSGGEKTWERKGSKHVKVLGQEDKRQVTVVVSSDLQVDHYRCKSLLLVRHNVHFHHQARDAKNALMLDFITHVL